MLERLRVILSAFCTFFFPPADAERPEGRDRLLSWREFIPFLFIVVLFALALMFIRE